MSEKRKKWSNTKKVVVSLLTVLVILLGTVIGFYQHVKNKIYIEKEPSKTSSTNEFEEVIASGKVLVDFFATWCGPCRMLTPVLEELSEEVSDVTIVKVDVDQDGALAQRFGIMAVPTMILFENGEPVKQLQGFMNKEALLAKIK